MTIGGAPVALDRRLTPDDLDAYLRLREESFGYPGRTDEVMAASLARLPRTLGAFVDDALVSSVTVHACRAYVAGVEVPFGAMAGVQSLAQHRRGGHAARLMLRALEEGRGEGFGWSLLYPFDEAFYGRLGWASVPTGVPLQLPPEGLPPGRSPRDGAKLTPVDGEASLQAAYGRFAPGRTFADTRRSFPRDLWASLTGPPGARFVRYASDAAFLVAQLHDEHERDVRLDVIDLGWCDASGREAVLGTIAAFRGQVARVRLEVPWDDPIAADRARAHRRRGSPGLMARVADAPLALAPLRAVADDDAPIDLPPVTIELIDANAPWHVGRWRLTPGPDGCGVARTVRPPDASLDVRGLTLLLAGAGAPADLRRVGLVEGDGRALRVVAALAGGRTPYRSPVDRF